MPDRPKSSRDRVRTHRERLRQQGLRHIQVWVPDVRSRAFKAQAHRQSLAVALSWHAADDQALGHQLRQPRRYSRWEPRGVHRERTLPTAKGRRRGAVVVRRLQDDTHGAARAPHRRLELNPRLCRRHARHESLYFVLGCPKLARRTFAPLIRSHSMMGNSPAARASIATLS